MKFTLYTLLLLVGSLTVQAATLKGSVMDARTGEPLIGATVSLINTKFGGTVGLDGSYLIKGVPAGTYTCLVQYVSYQKTQKTITINSESVVHNFALAESSHDLAEVIVSASGDRESDNSTRKTEQKADNVLNIIGAKAISLLPDVTVANVLQRVSGVSVVRNATGDGQFAIIRGMDRRYNYTLVNGIKIPSPDNKNRFVPMDIFPADLLERLEVVKALTPNMEGDAIGGSMNMIMRSAPDYLVVNATASGGYSQLFSSRPFSGFSTADINFRSPSEIAGSNRYAAKPSDFSVRTAQYQDVQLPINGLMSLSIGNRVFNKRLGFLVGGSYQHTYRGSESSFLRLYGQPSPDPVPNTPIFEFVEQRKYSNEQGRLGLNLKADYEFNRNNKLSLYGLFMQLDDKQHRTVLGNQLVQIGDVTTTDRSVFRRQNIYNITLQGDHALIPKPGVGRLQLNWSAVYSLAKSQTPNWTDLSVTSRTSQGADGKSVSTRYIDNMSYIWTRNNDRDLTGYVNLTYMLLPTFDVSVGGMYRAKNRDNYYNDYQLATVLPGGDRQVFTSVDKAIFSFRPESYAYPDSTNANNYTAKEQITAGYIQGKYIRGNWQVVGGVRAENTNQSYVSQLPVTATGKTGHVSYLDVLPSLHLKYQLSDRENLRLSYFRGISRPGYFEIVPAAFPGDFFTETGNFNLKHTVADNIDLRYELFPKGNEQLLLGAFVKNLQNPIEYGFSQLAQNNIVYQPINYGTAINYGAELVFAKYFSNWGVSGNYTYTKSSITTTKRVYGRDANGSTVVTDVQQTRPLQGQSDHIANLSLMYKNQRIGFDAQLAWVYTGKRINIVSAYKDLDYWQRGTSQVDFSAEKRFHGGRLSVFTKLANLLNNPIIVDILRPNTLSGYPDQDRSDRITVQKDVFQQSYLFGLRYKR
ncbi:TonB-dependent receptor [Spirosoma endbachense]|uniref:Outer membrane beta-barrel protein n=1 Tax=Spirosoma endbachense TaxID=2666025 RepID=A0A6P1VTF9_9BACT|nr:TonB-dependent receptor [Spirosoma endbachense]QHV95382.1 outer membrane beta-barrel protein [Spirosoma endbachense]